MPSRPEVSTLTWTRAAISERSEELNGSVKTKRTALCRPLHVLTTCRCLLIVSSWTERCSQGIILLPPSSRFKRCLLKRLAPIPNELLDQLKGAKETGIGYLVVSVELKDGRSFDQVATSEGCIIEVRGYKEIPFAPEDMIAVNVTHRGWNFRDVSDSRSKIKAAAT